MVFQCRATGIPPPAIEWTGSQLSQPIMAREGKYDIIGDTTLEDQGVGPHVVTSQLIILNLTISDEQSYTCNGANTINMAEHKDSAVVLLTVLGMYPPSAPCTYMLFFLLAEPFVVAVTSTPVLVFYNDPVMISFSVLGANPLVDPDNGIVWTFQSSSDSTAITETERYSFVNNNNALMINRARLEDTGTYSLTATNIAGSHTASVAINVVGK